MAEMDFHAFGHLYEIAVSYNFLNGSNAFGFGEHVAKYFHSSLELSKSKCIKFFNDLEKSLSDETGVNKNQIKTALIDEFDSCKNHALNRFDFENSFIRKDSFKNLFLFSGFYSLMVLVCGGLYDGYDKSNILLFVQICTSLTIALMTINLVLTLWSNLELEGKKLIFVMIILMSLNFCCLYFLKYLHSIVIVSLVISFVPFILQFGWSIYLYFESSKYFIYSDGAGLLKNYPNLNDFMDLLKKKKSADKQGEVLKEKMKTIIEK